jgi:FAD/FMN-containing dehydrogenase
MNVATSAVDFPVTRVVDVASADELREALIEAGRDPDAPERVRLIGAGTQQTRLPAPGAPVVFVRTAAMDRTLRLEADDQTCTVQPGVRRDVLDAELDRRGLCLPVVGGTTVAGLFAVGERGPAAPGAPSARSLLLGLEGVLGEGLAFASGARVVKSVAGFDLQKLFVGSRGRLFAVTALHVKLRPKPRAAAAFTIRGLDADAALALYRGLRLRHDPPATITLARDASGFMVGGRFEGTRAQVAAAVGSLPAHDDAPPPDEPTPRDGEELVRGAIRPSRLPALLAQHADLAFAVDGTGGFAIAIPRERTDAWLEDVHAHDAVAEIRCGAVDRRGRATRRDSAVAALDDDLRRALDTKALLR